MLLDSRMIVFVGGRFRCNDTGRTGTTSCRYDMITFTDETLTWLTNPLAADR